LEAIAALRHSKKTRVRSTIQEKASELRHERKLGSRKKREAWSRVELKQEKENSVSMFTKEQRNRGAERGLIEIRRSNAVQMLIEINIQKCENRDTGTTKCYRTIVKKIIEIISSLIPHMICLQVGTK
jgi:hypothetical protein